MLALPWGFELYGLLTRWNPLDRRRPFARPYHGKNVLVVGLGPAGYTLAHYLLNEGFDVAGIDGLKLEPLPDALGGQRPLEPVRDFAQLTSELDERVLAGFGGVSEYGITVRWDKNFLTADPPARWRAAEHVAPLRRRALRRHPHPRRRLGARLRPRRHRRRSRQAHHDRDEEQPASAAFARRATS